VKTEQKTSDKQWLKVCCQILAIFAIVALWYGAVAFSRRHAQEAGRELASVNLLVKYPSPNWAGTQALIARSTEIGVAVVLVDWAGGRRQKVYEAPESRILSGSLLLLEWAPDDTVCCYAKPIKGKQQSVVFCSAITGTTAGSLTVTGYVKEFKWLSPSSLAYLNDRQEIHMAVRNSQGKWSHARRFEIPGNPAPTHLSAVSPTQVAWKQSGALWTGTISDQQSRLLWKPETNRLISCYSSPESASLLVNAQNRDRGHSALAVRRDGQKAELLGHVAAGPISKMNWADAGRGFAWQRTDHWGDSLEVWTDGTRGPHTLFAEGDVIDFKTRGRKIFVYGSRGQEPPGLWEHDLGTGLERPLVEAMEKDFKGVASVRHESGMMTNAGRVVPYQRWFPSGRRGTKRPVILAQTPFRWSPYPYVAALAGFEFVSMNRKNWESGIDHWEEDVLAMREELCRRGEADPGRIYLYGHSAETSPISSLGAAQPGLWRGALMLSPSALPDLTTCRFTRLFIDAGELDTGARERLEAYQNDAARAGVATRVVIHPQALHTSWSRSTEREKVRELALWLATQ
jgi:predicted esterase